MYKKMIRQWGIVAIGFVFLMFGGCVRQETFSSQVSYPYLTPNINDTSLWNRQLNGNYAFLFPLPTDSYTDSRSGSGPFQQVVAIDDEVLYTISVLDSYTLKNPNERDDVDWEYFLDNLPPQTLAHSDIQLDWTQYHHIKDTFEPNTEVNNIPMYVESGYGKVYLMRGDESEQYYFRAHFFIQDGLNYIRVTYPIYIATNSSLSTMSRDEILSLIQSEDPPKEITLQRELFNKILEKIEVIDKFNPTSFIDSIDVSSWKTYDSSQNNFSFQYPDHFSLDENEDGSLVTMQYKFEGTGNEIRRIYVNIGNENYYSIRNHETKVIGTIADEDYRIDVGSIKKRVNNLATQIRYVYEMDSPGFYITVESQVNGSPIHFSSRISVPVGKTFLSEEEAKKYLDQFKNGERLTYLDTYNIAYLNKIIETFREN